MKLYSISYSMYVSGDINIEANTPQEALEKFRETSNVKLLENSEIVELNEDDEDFDFDIDDAYWENVDGSMTIEDLGEAE